MTKFRGKKKSRGMKVVVDYFETVGNLWKKERTTKDEPRSNG